MLNQLNHSQLLVVLCNNPEEGLLTLFTTYGSLIHAIVSCVLRRAPQDAEKCIADVLVAI